MQHEEPDLDVGSDQPEPKREAALSTALRRSLNRIHLPRAIPDERLIARFLGLTYRDCPRWLLVDTPERYSTDHAAELILDPQELDSDEGTAKFQLPPEARFRDWIAKMDGARVVHRIPIQRNAKGEQHPE